MPACTIKKRHTDGAKKSGTVIGFDRVVVRACFGAFKNLFRRGKNGLRDNRYFLNLSSHFSRQISSIQAPLVIFDCKKPRFCLHDDAIFSGK